jgi:hypothetical protein
MLRPSGLINRIREALAPSPSLVGHGEDLFILSGNFDAIPYFQDLVLLDA